MCFWHVLDKDEGLQYDEENEVDQNVLMFWGGIENSHCLYIYPQPQYMTYIVSTSRCMIYLDSAA